MNHAYLDALVAAPFATALLVMLVGRRSEGAGVGLAVLGSLVIFGWSIPAVLEDRAVDAVWIESLDVHWHLLLDGISAPLLLLTTLVTLCCQIALVRHAPDCGGRASLAALLMLIESGVIGAFLAVDMVLFFLFFEVALIPMWFVINAWGDQHDPIGRRRAATRFLVFTVLGSALMIVGFLIVKADSGTFDITQVSSASTVAAVLVGIGLAVKTPLWPVHIWLPDAHAKAPTVGSVILAALLLKLGTYGFIRFWLPLVDPADDILPVFAGLAVVGIVYGALACLAQTDLKRLIAYSSVGHMGFVVLAITSYTTIGVQAAVYASVAHGLITGLLFFAAGAIKDRYGTGDLAELKALYGAVPRLAGVLAFAAMASLGLPGLAGFWGEMLAIRSALFAHDALPHDTFVVLSVIAALGVILTSAYFLVMMRTLLQGEPGPRGSSRDASEASQRVETKADLHWLEWAAWSPLLVLTVVLGVAPGLLLDPVATAMTGVLR
ncbi:MAG TPA: NADH-quinone oxidoreductase subunit M [Nocardioidaceae bacterium]|nr:NADH-quinone oxidoreductase subunit M [Nocardioidaceae bacterium]